MNSLLKTIWLKQQVLSKSSLPISVLVKRSLLVLPRATANHHLHSPINPSKTLHKQSNILPCLNHPNFVQLRFKKKFAKSGGGKRGASSNNEEDSDNEKDKEDQDSDDEDEEGGLDNDTKVVTTGIISLRLDVVGKTCLNIQRAKFDENFYKV